MSMYVVLPAKTFASLWPTNVSKADHGLQLNGHNIPQIPPAPFSLLLLHHHHNRGMAYLRSLQRDLRVSSAFHRSA